MELTLVNALWLVSYVALWGIALLSGFLLLGVLQNLGRLRWRLEQLEATAPRRVGRGGLKAGTKAPDFRLSRVGGGEVALHDFAGRRVLLVFTQNGCEPCHRVFPELDKLQRGGRVQVLVVNNGDPAADRAWDGAARACFPVLIQEGYSVSRRYEAVATPFALLIDERGTVRSKGVINNGQHIRFVLEGAGGEEGTGPAPMALNGKAAGQVEGPLPSHS